MHHFQFLFVCVSFFVFFLTKLTHFFSQWKLINLLCIPLISAVLLQLLVSRNPICSTLQTIKGGFVSKQISSKNIFWAIVIRADQGKKNVLCMVSWRSGREKVTNGLPCVLQSTRRRKLSVPCEAHKNLIEYFWINVYNSIIWWYFSLNSNRSEE